MNATTVDLCEIPGGVSPDGVYNFVNPPCLGYVVIIVGVVLGVISMLFAAGRLYINRHKMHLADCRYWKLLGNSDKEPLTSHRLYSYSCFDRCCLHRNNCLPWVFSAQPISLITPLTQLVEPF